MASWSHNGCSTAKHGFLQAVKQTTFSWGFFFSFGKNKSPFQCLQPVSYYFISHTRYCISHTNTFTHKYTVAPILGHPWLPKIGERSVFLSGCIVILTFVSLEQRRIDKQLIHLFNGYWNGNFKFQMGRASPPREQDLKNTPRTWAPGGEEFLSVSLLMLRQHLGHCPQQHWTNGMDVGDSE